LVLLVYVESYVSKKIVSMTTFTLH
jgi:hypothetical protein